VEDLPDARILVHAEAGADGRVSLFGDDEGPGLAPGSADRVFEPFYTTKDVGEGTGLGLDISRRIVVERHGGEISIESRPGETVVAVRLPLHSTALR
jgi:signal transduction histidine kinase